LSMARPVPWSQALGHVRCRRTEPTTGSMGNATTARWLKASWPKDQASWRIQVAQQSATGVASACSSLPSARSVADLRWGARSYQLMLLGLHLLLALLFSLNAPGGCAKAPTAGQRNERTRVVCHVCGYKSVPQWMNDRAHCLKCDAVLKTQATIHGSSAVPENMEKDLGASRASGEVSTYKLAPSSAMESSSGTCSKSPNGMHHWKYGKCNYCQAAEGKLIKGAGAIANPGGASTCNKDGGKCMFKFSKCTKCGRREV
ncbi:unnamed protein product, partial [Symbiodinium sp. CCMP2456]